MSVFQNSRASGPVIVAMPASVGPIADSQQRTLAHRGNGVRQSPQFTASGVAARERASCDGLTAGGA